MELETWVDLGVSSRPGAQRRVTAVVAACLKHRHEHAVFWECSMCRTERVGQFQQQIMRAPDGVIWMDEID